MKFLRCLVVYSCLLVSCNLWASHWQEVYQNINNGLMEEAFFCQEGERDPVTLVFSREKSGILYDINGQPYPLTHQIKEGQLVISVPSLNLRQQSLFVEGAHGLITGIRFPYSFCYPVSHNLSQQFQTDVWVDCGEDPGSYIPGVGYNSNLFILSRRQQWNEQDSSIVPGGALQRKNTETRDDTISNFHYGVYRVYDKNLFLYFGEANQRVLFTGFFTDDYSRVLIRELGAADSGGQWCKVSS